VLLQSDLDVQQTHLISLTIMNLVTPKVGAEHKLLFNKLASEAGLLNKRLMLSSSFRCDQIHKYEKYDFGHTLLCYLSRT